MANTSAVIPVGTQNRAALCADARNLSVSIDMAEERSSGQASSGASTSQDDVVVLDSSDDEGDEGRSGGGAGGRASHSPPRANYASVGGAGRRSSAARKRRRKDEVVDLTNVVDDPAPPPGSGCDESDHDSDIVIVAEEPAQEHSARVGGAGVRAPGALGQSGQVAVNAGKAPKHEDEEEEEPPVSMDCTVCLGGIREATVTKCWHVFCNACIRDWLKKKNDCPICRKKVLVKDLHRIMAT